MWSIAVIYIITKKEFPIKAIEFLQISFFFHFQNSIHLLLNAVTPLSPRDIIGLRVAKLPHLPA
jgi:hypothetical protein